MTSEVNRADRVLVWLVLAGLVFGGLATMVVAFSAERVLAGLSAVEAPTHDDHDGATLHDEGAADHADDDQGHEDGHSMSTSPPSGSADQATSMPMSDPTATAGGHGH